MEIENLQTIEKQNIGFRSIVFPFLNDFMISEKRSNQISTSDLKRLEINRFLIKNAINISDLRTKILKMVEMKNLLEINQELKKSLNNDKFNQFLTEIENINTLLSDFVN